MSYENLHETAHQIYTKAVEMHMSDAYDWFFVDGRWQAFARDDDPEEFQRHWTISEAEFAQVPALFDEFIGMSDPASYDDAIGSMQNVLASLSGGEDGLQDPVAGELYPNNSELLEMTPAASYIAGWDGLAMRDFVENFSTQFVSRTANQFNAACVLTHALRAEQAMWTEARLNVATIASQTLAALDHAGDWSGDDTDAVFTVVGAVVEIGSLFAPGAGAAATALKAVGAANGIASEWAGNREDPPPIPFSGGSARAVIDSSVEALNELKGHIRAAEEKVQSACSSANGTLLSYRTDYVAPEPQLAGENPDTGRPD